MKRLSAVLAVALLVGPAAAGPPPPAPPADKAAPGLPLPPRPPVLRARVSLDVIQNGRTLGLEGHLAWQVGGNFRLRGQALGKPVLDLGSNREEVWAWMRLASAQGLICVSRKGVAEGKESWPTGINPQWAGWFLGLDEGATNWRWMSLGGPALSKMTELNCIRLRGEGGGPLLTRRLVYRNGKEVVRATVAEVHADAGVPRQMELTWPAERLRVLVTLTDIKVNLWVTPEREKVLFSPPPELARARPSAPPPRESVGPPPELAPVVLAVSDKSVSARWGEESFRLATRPDDRLATQLLRDQLEEWVRQVGKRSLTARVTWGPGVEHAPLKAVLQACRLAGIRRLELGPTKEATANSRR